jgi:hypothetical protein
MAGIVEAFVADIPQWGRAGRRIRRETARELARQLMVNHPSERKREWDAGWFLAAFMALGLLLIAPKVGREVTGAVLVAMGACLIHPIWKLGFVREAPTLAQRRIRFLCTMIAGVIAVALFGLYVWPPIRRHTLSAKERAAFEDALRAEKGGDANLEVQIACPSGDEKTCVYAGQFVELFGRAGWQIHPSVDRLILARASDGITALRRAGNKAHMLQHWDSGGYVAINEAHLLAVNQAFEALHIEIDSAADPDLAENVMRLYVGPEKDNESEPTHLTRSIEWVTGKHMGPFPQQ